METTNLRGRQFRARLVVAGFVLCACGSSSAPAPSTGPVSVGVLSCFSGSFAGLGDAMLQGSQIAQKAINDGGGILGRQLTLAHADTRCNEADAVPAVRTLLSGSNLVGIIGPETQEINAVAPIVTAAKIPTEFQGGSTVFDKNANPYLWRDRPSDSQLGVAMALFAFRKEYRNAALVFSSDTAAQTFAATITATFQKLGGKIVSSVTIMPAQTSYHSQAQQVIGAKPDVIFTQTDAPTAAVLFQNFKELNGLDIPFVGTDVTGGDDYLKAITYQVAHDHLISVRSTAVTGQAVDEFNKIFTQLFGSANQPSANANFAYDAVISLALAVEKAKSIAGSDIDPHMSEVTTSPGTQCYTYSDCLALIKGGTKIDYEGASGNLDYDKFNNVYGPYAAFRASVAGQQVQVQAMSAADLAAATP